MSEPTPATWTARDPDAAVTGGRSTQVDQEWFVFRLAARAYALPPSCVEIVAPPMVAVPVPTAPAWCIGVVHLRGRLVVVVDLPAVLGVSGPASEDSARLVIARLGDSPVAFRVDEAYGLWNVPAEQVGRPDEGDRLLTARFTARDLAVGALDPAGLVATLRAGRGEAVR